MPQIEKITCFNCAGNLHETHDGVWVHSDGDERCETRSKWTTRAWPVKVRES